MKDVIAELVVKLVAAGATPEAIGIAVSAVAASRGEDAEAEERRKAAQRERTKRYREKRGIRFAEWQFVCDQVYDRDGRVCAYCGDQDGPFSIDHVVPVSRGGTNDLDNLAVACRDCNSSKADRLLSEWEGRP